MNSTAIANLQRSLGLPVTGVLDDKTYGAMSGAVSRAVSAHPAVKTYSGGTDPEAILNAYMTGDWSGVTSLTGKPFSDDEQKAAVAAASAALAPGFNATAAYDRAKTEDSFAKTVDTYAAGQASDAEQFQKDKNTLDKNAADSGVLYSGSRIQKLNQLGGDYAAREAAARSTATSALRNTARDFAYNYGSPAAQGLKSYYSLPNSPAFNARVAGGKVTPGSGLSAAYDPNEFAYQGTKPVAQTAAVQTRAASLLANRANKLALGGYANKF